MICGAIGVAANGSIGFQRRAGKAGRSDRNPRLQLRHRHAV